MQALNITNSLDSLRLMAFDGFSKLMSINLSSMPYLEYINFTDMLKSNEVSTLSNIRITDCPQVTSIAFNVTDNNHKVEFAVQELMFEQQQVQDHYKGGCGADGKVSGVGIKT